MQKTARHEAYAALAVPRLPVLAAPSSYCKVTGVLRISPPRNAPNERAPLGQQYHLHASAMTAAAFRGVRQLASVKGGGDAWAAGHACASQVAFGWHTCREMGSPHTCSKALTVSMNMAYACDPHSQVLPVMHAQGPQATAH